MVDEDDAHTAKHCRGNTYTPTHFVDTNVVAHV